MAGSGRAWHQPGKSFVRAESSRQLASHNQMCDSPSNFNCNENKCFRCGKKSFHIEDNLKKHRETNHIIQRRAQSNVWLPIQLHLQCYCCDKVFDIEDNLEKHNRTEHTLSRESSRQLHRSDVWLQFHWRDTIQLTILFAVICEEEKNLFKVLLTGGNVCFLLSIVDLKVQ